MRIYKLFFFRNLLLLTLLYGIGYQTLTFSYLDSFKAKHLKVNLTENICGADIEISDLDQNTSFTQEILRKKIISSNFLHEKTIFLPKIYLNYWKPPKIVRL